jgi:hypothetical protein
MRLYTLNDVPLERVTQVYRNASWRGLGLAALIMTAMPMIIVWVNPHDKSTFPLVAFTALIALFFCALFLRRFIQEMGRRQWLLVQAEEGIYINFSPPWRPFGNPSRPGAAFIPRVEIAAVGKTHETRRFDGPYAIERHFAYIDLYLTHENTEALLHALRQERRALPKGRDAVCPIRLPAPGVVRILWDRVYPPENTAIAMLNGEYPAMADRTVCYADWERMSREEKLHIVRDLWETGHVAEAMRLHRVVTGDDFHTTRTYFDGLTEEAQDES